MQGWGGEAGREQRSHLKIKKKKDKKTTPALHGGRQNDCTKAPFQGWNFTTPTWLKDSTEGGGRRLKATVLQINLFLVRMAWIRKHLHSLGSIPFPHLQASPYPPSELFAHRPTLLLHSCLPLLRTLHPCTNQQRKGGWEGILTGSSKRMTYMAGYMS